MGTPATDLAPPTTTTSTDDLDEAALARWWAQTSALRSPGMITRRLRPADLLVPTPPSPAPATPAAQDRDDR